MEYLVVLIGILQLFVLALLVSRLRAQDELLVIRRERIATLKEFINTIRDEQGKAPYPFYDDVKEKDA